ncbi:hypothetical protein EI555_012514, partial [Monodon monoceros]
EPRGNSGDETPGNERPRTGDALSLGGRSFLHSRGPVSRAERRRKQGAGRAALALVTVVLRHGRSANPGDRAGRGRAPLAAPRPLAPSIAWRRAGKLASWQAGSAPQEGKEREGQLTLPPPSPLSQREARSPHRSRADQSLQPHGECGLRPANPDREPTTPSMQCAGDTSGRWGARARRALARRPPGGCDGFVARVGSTAGGAEAGLRGGVHHSQPSALQRAPRMASPARAGCPARAGFPAPAWTRSCGGICRPAVYDAIRAYEQCIVVSDTGKHTLKYVLLSDRLIYLTENPLQSIRRVVALRNIAAIDLVPPREQHTTIQGLNSWPSFRPQEAVPSWPKRSCQPTSATSKAVGVPFCTTNTKEPQGLSDHKDSLSEIPFKCSGNGNEFYLGNSSLASPLQSNPNLEKKEKLLFYKIPYMLVSSVLLLEEKIKHFSQLKSELFLKDNTLRKILCLITELKVAAPKNFILKRLFWKTSDLFYFLVNKLHEYLPESRDKNAHQNKSQSVGELVACIEIIQTLGLMFRETETEASALNTLAAKK